MRNLLLVLAHLISLSALASTGYSDLGGGGTALQGSPVSSTAPTTGQCLVAPSNGNWAPGSCSSGSVTGAGSSVAHDLVGFADTTGALLEDSGLLASSIVTKTGTQTLTNKTLTSPAVNGATIGGTTAMGQGNSKILITDSSGNLSNETTITGAQLPMFTGDVTNSSAAMTVAKIQGTAVTGTTGSGNVVLDTSPTISGSSTSIKTGNCYVTPQESDLGNSGASKAIDLSTATTFTVTLNNATPTLTFSNPVAGCAYAIILTQDGTGSRVPTWAGTTNIWGNSGAKTLSTTASAVDKVTCVYNANITSLMCDLGKAYQ